MFVWYFQPHSVFLICSNWIICPGLSHAIRCYSGHAVLSLPCSHPQNLCSTGQIHWSLTPLGFSMECKQEECWKALWVARTQACISLWGAQVCTSLQGMPIGRDARSRTLAGSHMTEGEHYHMGLGDSLMNLSANQSTALFWVLATQLKKPM